MRAMRRVMLALLVAIHATPAVAACPEWLVADMAERGVPGFEIGRMCGPAPSRTLAPPAAAPAPVQAPAPAPMAGAPAPARSLGAQQAGQARGGSKRCVAEAGPACTTPSLRPVGSPCWCGGEGGPREGTIR